MSIFAKTAYKNGSNPASSLLFRFLISGLILLLYLKLNNISIKISLKQFFLLFFIGMFDYTITTITLFESYNYLNSDLATSLHYIYAALVCIFSFILYRESITKEKILSLVLSLTGFYLVKAFGSKSLNIVGIFLAVLSDLGYSNNLHWIYF